MFKMPPTMSCRLAPGRVLRFRARSPALKCLGVTCAAPATLATVGRAKDSLYRPYPCAQAVRAIVTNTAGNTKPPSLTQLYQPLDPKAWEIRVLDLEGSSDRNSVLRCKLRTISLLRDRVDPTPDNPTMIPPYEALSYTWGDPTAGLVEMSVNDQPFAITRNLESFLRVRRRQAEGKGVALWVDAVCINQADPLEKNHQIPLMVSIYCFARKLTVWLGPVSADSDLAIDTIKRLGAGSPYDKLPALTPEEMSALRDLLSRPWWGRVWIIQELALGSLGPKVAETRLHCGEVSVKWINVVVAAARLKAHEDELRQGLPDATNILELDGLWASSLNTACRDGTDGKVEPTMVLDLVSRFRHFLSTDPRDKIFALCNQFSIGPLYKHIKPRYDVPVEEVYTSFAADQILNGRGLEILRHCDSSIARHTLPSWVPDWSVPLACQVLPLRKIRRYYDVPWWAEPIHLKPQGSQPIGHGGYREASTVTYGLAYYDGRDRAEYLRKRRTRIRRLEIAAKGSGFVNSLSEIPPGFIVDGHMDILNKCKDEIEMMLQQGKLVLHVRESRIRMPDHELYDPKTALDSVTQGEIMTEMRMKRWVLEELRSSDPSTAVAPYYASGKKAATDANAISTAVLEENGALLRVNGILWDTVEACNENSFVPNVEVDWKDATRFMVAVGCAKKLALASPAARDRYPSLEARLEAFWLTLFAGRAPEQGMECYTDWLPEIPPSWKRASPPVTALTTGLAGLAEGMVAIDEVMAKDPSLAREGVSRSDAGDDYTQERLRGLEGGDMVQHKASLNAVAATWSKQPYDLYHRPFYFLNMVPDPYWEARRESDDLALRQTQVRVKPPLMSFPQTSETGPQITKEDAIRIRNSILKALRSKPSMVPQAVLDAGYEKYALGRRFWVTKKGYFGIGPSDTKPGDRIAVLHGAQVPFVLRKHEAAGATGLRGWKLVGESYVHHIMKGEVMKMWENGMIESGPILLR